MDKTGMKLKQAREGERRSIVEWLKRRAAHLDHRANGEIVAFKAENYHEAAMRQVSNRLHASAALMLAEQIEKGDHLK